MKKLTLTKKEINILKDLKNNLNETEILRDLKKYWLIKGADTDTSWFVFASLDTDWKQLLKELDIHKWPLDGFNFTLNFWFLTISTK